MKPHSMQKQAEKHLLNSHDWSKRGSRDTVANEKIRFKGSRVPDGGLVKALEQKGQLSNSMNVGTLIRGKSKQKRPGSSVLRPPKSKKYGSLRQTQVIVSDNFDSNFYQNRNAESSANFLSATNTNCLMESNPNYVYIFENQSRSYAGITDQIRSPQIHFQDNYNGLLNFQTSKDMLSASEKDFRITKHRNSSIINHKFQINSQQSFNPSDTVASYQHQSRSTSGLLKSEHRITKGTQKFRQQGFTNRRPKSAVQSNKVINEIAAFNILNDYMRLSQPDQLSFVTQPKNQDIMGAIGTRVAANSAANFYQTQSVVSAQRITVDLQKKEPQENLISIKIPESPPNELQTKMIDQAPKVKMKSNFLAELSNDQQTVTNEHVARQNSERGPFSNDITETELLQSPNHEKQGVLSQNLNYDVQNNIYEIDEEDELIQSPLKMKNQNNYELTPSYSPGLPQGDDPDSLIKFYQKQVHQDSQNIRKEYDSSPQLELALSPILSEDPSRQRATRPLQKSKSSEPRSTALNHNYIYNQKMEQYKQKLYNCAQSLIILNKRLKSAANPRSYEELVREDIEKTSQRISAIVNTGSFADEREEKYQMILSPFLQQSDYRSHIEISNDPVQTFAPTIIHANDTLTMGLTHDTRKKSIESRNYDSGRNHQKSIKNLQAFAQKQLSHTNLNEDLQILPDSNHRNSIEEQQAILNSIQEYENFGREIIMHSFSNMQPIVSQLDEKKEISGWPDLENAPQHLLPCSSLVDAVIGRFDESEQEQDTPNLPPDRVQLKLNSNNSQKSLTESQYGQIKMSHEFQKLHLGVKVIDRKGNVSQNNNDLSSPNLVSPLIAPMELTTNQSQRQFSSSTSPEFPRKMLNLKDSQIDIDVDNNYLSERQILRQEIRNRKKVLQMSKGQLSTFNNAYLNKLNTHLYLNQKPTSSKDALLERPLLSQSLMQRRRQNINKQMGELYKSPANYMHGLDGALKLKNNRASQSSSHVNSPQNMNGSIMSTLMAGGHETDKMRNTSQSKKGMSSPMNAKLDITQMLAPVSSNSVHGGDTISKNETTRSLRLARDAELPIKQLKSANMQSVNELSNQFVQQKAMLLEQRAQMEIIKIQLEEAKQQVPPLSNSLTSWSLLKNEQQEENQPEAVFSNSKVSLHAVHKNQKEVTYDMKIENPRQLLPIDSLVMNSFIEPAPTKIPIPLEQKPPKAAMKISEDQKLLLAEMRRQMQEDDDLLLEILREQTTRGIYKYDAVEINKSILKKAKQQALSNLENNPIVKEVIYTKLTKENPSIPQVSGGYQIDLKSKSNSVKEESQESEENTLERVHEGTLQKKTFSARMDSEGMESRRRPVIIQRENLTIKVNDKESQDNIAVSRTDLVLPIKMKQERSPYRTKAVSNLTSKPNLRLSSASFTQLNHRPSSSYMRPEDLLMPKNSSEIIEPVRPKYQRRQTFKYSTKSRPMSSKPPNSTGMVVVGTQEHVKHRWETNEWQQVHQNIQMDHIESKPPNMVFGHGKRIGPGFWPEINNSQDIEKELRRINELETRIKKEMGKIPNVGPQSQHGTLTVLSNKTIKSP